MPYSSKFLREVDKLIAQNAMQWETDPDLPKDGTYFPGTGPYQPVRFEPTICMDHALLAVEKMPNFGWNYFSVERQPNGIWCAELLDADRNIHLQEAAETAALATSFVICRAFGVHVGS